MIKKSKKGFTLVELLAVIVILGIILLIAVPVATNYINKSKKKSFFTSVSNITNKIKTENIIEENDYCMYSYRDDKENQTELIDSMYVIVHKEEGKIMYSVYARQKENTVDIDIRDFSTINMNDSSKWVGSFDDNSYSKLVGELSDSTKITHLSNYKVCGLKEG